MRFARKFKTHGVRGAGMLELIIAFTVLVIGLIPTVSLIINMRQGIENRDIEINTILSAQSLLEIIKSKKWDETSTVPAAYIATPSALGVDSGELTMSQYDDIDDFNGYSDSPSSNITRTVTVKYVLMPLNGDVTDAASGVKTDFKLVQVDIKRVGTYKVNQSVQTIIANLP